MIVAVAILMISCQKHVELESTFVQIKTKNFWDGNAIGNIGFTINSPYSSTNYGLSDTTNAYGNYIGSYTNAKKESYELRLEENYYLVGGPRVLTGSTENVLNLEVVEMGKFQYDIDCNLGGSITNLKRAMLTPISPSSAVYDASEGQTKTDSNPSCSQSQSIYTVFAGEWLITYQKRAAGSSVWVNYSDTVLVKKYETVIHQINY